jgi:hypothetical protein
VRLLPRGSFAFGGIFRLTPIAVLATAVLRFQRLEPEEANGEAELHAHESGKARIGGGCEALALEQLSILSVW